MAFFDGVLDDLVSKKSDSEVLDWYRNQKFYDPRRSMAIRAWFNDDLKLASVLLNYIK